MYIQLPNTHILSQLNFLKYYFKLEYSSFTLLYYFLLQSKVNQLYTHIHEKYSHIRSLQSIEYSFLYYIVGPYQLSIIYRVVCVYIYPSLPPFTLVTIFLRSVTKFLFYIKMIFIGFQNTENFLKISPKYLLHHNT